MNQEDIFCERTIKVKELICEKTGRLNKWFNMFRDIDNQLLAKIRILTRLHKNVVFNTMLKSLSYFNQKKKCKIINRIKI